MDITLCNLYNEIHNDNNFEQNGFNVVLRGLLTKTRTNRPWERYEITYKINKGKKGLINR